jgi:protein deglycase
MHYRSAVHRAYINLERGQGKEISMSKDIMVSVADGSEELEAVAIVDVLRRAGAQVTIASVDGLEISGSKGVRLIADRLAAECVDDVYDLIVLPGGMPGSAHLRDSEPLIRMIRRQAQENRLYGAICAAPAVVLHPHGLVDKRRVACHPDFGHLIKNAELTSDAVVVDGNVITGRGAGTAIEFSLALVELLFDREKAREVARGMAFRYER